MNDAWRPARLFRAVAGGEPEEVFGYERDGLALLHFGWATPRTETRWSLVHVNSGASFLRFTGNVATVFPVASRIAECSDWTLFSLPEGWRQTDPDLAAKVGAICEAHSEARPDISFDAPSISDADARAVIEAREAVDEGWRCWPPR